MASETSWERFSRRTLLGGAIRTRRTYVFGLGLVALLLLSSLAAASEGGPRRAASNPDVPSTPTPVRATPVEAAERALPISPEVRTGVGEFAWTNVTYGPAPSPRQGYGIAYDANDGYVVLFGGYPVGGGPRTFLNDTWTFRGGLWTNITSTAGIAPAAREYPQMLYDASDGSILLLGGETFEGTATDVWSFSTGHWTELNATEPPALEGRCGYQATYDSTEGVALILVPTCFSNTTNPVYMYAYHAGVWSNLSVNHTTNQSLPATMLGTSSLLVDDPTLHGVVLFGGFNSSTRDGLNETWLYSGGNWTDLAAGLTGGGPARFEPGGDFDTAYPGVLVFGGFVCECELDSTNVTWILSNTTWTEFAPGPAPAQAEGSSYWGGAAVWDGADNATVWFGGNDNATWEWGGPPAPFGLTLDASPNPADSNVSIAFSSTHVGGTGPDSVRLVVWGWFDERERSAAACLRFRRHVPGRPDDSRRGGSDDDRVAFGLGRFGTRRDHHRPAGPGRRGDFDELLGPNHRGVRRGRGELELGGRHERRQRFVPGTRVLGRRKLHGEPKRDRCGGRPICSVDGSPGRPGPRPPDDRGEPVRSGAWSTRPIHGFGAGRDRPVHVFLGVRRRGNWWESLDNLAYLHDERAVRHDRHRPRRSRRGHVGLVEPIDCPQRYGCRELNRRRGPARCGV